MPKPHRARVKRVSSAHHEDVGGGASRISFGSRGSTPGPRSEAVACRRPRRVHVYTSKRGIYILSTSPNHGRHGSLPKAKTHNEPSISGHAFSHTSIDAEIHAGKLGLYGWVRHEGTTPDGRGCGSHPCPHHHLYRCSGNIRDPHQPKDGASSHIHGFHHVRIRRRLMASATRPRYVEPGLLAKGDTRMLPHLLVVGARNLCDRGLV
jgi:hypothetical protein